MSSDKSASVTPIGLLLCEECNHPWSEHEEGWVCVHNEDGTYEGVCPCTRPERRKDYA